MQLMLNPQRGKKGNGLMRRALPMLMDVTICSKEVKLHKSNQHLEWWMGVLQWLLKVSLSILLLKVCPAILKFIVQMMKRVAVSQ